jgi:hypothetical protein
VGNGNGMAVDVMLVASLTKTPYVELWKGQLAKLVQKKFTDLKKTLHGAVVRAACNTSKKYHWNGCRCDVSTKSSLILLKKTLNGAVERAPCNTCAKIYTFS